VHDIELHPALCQSDHDNLLNLARPLGNLGFAGWVPSLG
jgi:hypothetical protein